MNNNNFLMALTLLTLIHAAFRPGACSGLMFTVAAISFAVSSLITAKRYEVAQAEISKIWNTITSLQDEFVSTTKRFQEVDTMKKAVDDLHTQVKGTINKITGIKMSIGLTD